jgi:uncharacterized membrane protein YeaQ/YmgE (transglycosylase-associated protein family)
MRGEGVNMTASAVLSWALCGLVVGLIARLIVPGGQAIGIIRTILLGIVGAFVGALIYWLFNGAPGEPFTLAGNAWHGWLFSILGAVIVLYLFTWWQQGRSGKGWW